MRLGVLLKDFGLCGIGFSWEMCVLARCCIDMDVYWLLINDFAACDITELPDSVVDSVLDGGNELVLGADCPNTLAFNGGDGLGRAGVVLVDLLKGFGLMRVIAVRGAWGAAVVADEWLRWASTTELAS